MSKLTEQDVIHQLEAQQRKSAQAVRDLLMEKGRTDLVKELDKNLRDVEMGITGARATWSALTEPQRRVVRVLAETGHTLRRTWGTKKFYDAEGGQPMGVSRIAGIATVRNLERRDLLSWNGGAFDPEASAVLTEHARFVLKHGKTD